jgi:hypothetical protein
MCRRMARAALAALAVSGCTNLETYSLQGQRYDEDGDCLGPSEVIDIVEGTAEGTCDGVKCIQSEETGFLWVTPNCEVPELYVDLTDDDGACADALAAFERGDDGLCE